VIEQGFTLDCWVSNEGGRHPFDSVESWRPAIDERDTRLASGRDAQHRRGTVRSDLP